MASRELGPLVSAAGQPRRHVQAEAGERLRPPDARSSALGESIVRHEILACPGHGEIASGSARLRARVGTATRERSADSLT